MMASTLAFRLMLMSSFKPQIPRLRSVAWRLAPLGMTKKGRDDAALKRRSTKSLLGDHSPPIILHWRSFCHQRIEMGVLLEHDLAEDFVLACQHRLQTNQLQNRQERAHQRRARAHVAQQLLQPDGTVFQGEPPPHIVNHLRNCYAVVL